MSQNSYVKNCKAKAINTYWVPWISIANHMILFRFMLSSVIRKIWQIICFQLTCPECFEPDCIMLSNSIFGKCIFVLRQKQSKFQSISLVQWLFQMICSFLFHVMGSLVVFFVLVIALLRCIWYTIKFILLRYTIKQFLVYLQSCATITTT